MAISRLSLILPLSFSIAVSESGVRSVPISRSHIGTLAAAAQMLEPRSGHTATLLPDGKVLIAGGMRRNQDFYQSAELYNPATHRFERTGDMHQKRVSHIAVLLHSGKVLIAGGWIGRGCTDTAELYDGATGQFTAIAAQMTTPRGHAAATLLANGDVLITGGADHDSPGGVASAEIFRAATMKFEAVGRMHEARVAHTATLLNDGRVLIAGGRGEKVNATAEIYDPQTRRFTETGCMMTARYKHTAGALPDGRILVAGGSDERDWQGNLNSAEIFDPKTGKFSPISVLNESRFKLPAEAARLSSGELLIAGGSKKVELFDPATGNFRLVTGEMADARHFMTETRLKDGSVLLAGGYPDNDQATAQTWIYHP